MRKLRSYASIAALGAVALSFALKSDALADPDPTKDLLGIWAHSEADCQTKLSGSLDGGDLSRPQQTPYELIGFCKDGMSCSISPSIATRRTSRSRAADTGGRASAG